MRKVDCKVFPRNLKQEVDTMEYGVFEERAEFRPVGAGRPGILRRSRT